MPLVFVHGVATREGKKYRAQKAGRAALLKQLVSPVLGEDSVPLEPFWGDKAATFWWEHASLPVPADAEETYGLGDADEVLAVHLADGDDPANPLLAIARRSLPEAVDVLWAYAGEITPDLADWAAFAGWAITYAEEDPQPDWLSGCDSDEKLLAALLSRMPADDDEDFGPGRLAGVGREAVARMSRAATAGLVQRLRPGFTAKVSTFLGDAFSYLRQREEHGADGKIAKKVAESIIEAMQAGGDHRLVIIAHSMGGNIVYDLLSNLRKHDLRCDELITVGSQVGLFAELGLLPAVQKPDAVTQRVPALDGVRWLNVFDPQDPLAFVAGRIFDGVTDQAFSTGRSVLGAHSSYFTGPRFFQLIAQWLAR